MHATMRVDPRHFCNFYKYKRKLSIIVRSLCDGRASFDKLKVLFFGTDNFSLPSLKALHDECKTRTKISTLGVVTSFKGTSNPVRTYTNAEGLQLYKWPLEEDTASAYDLGIVVSFGYLIPRKIISAFPLGMINVHASILPRWRGAAPIIYAIMHGDKTTGVSIMRIEPKYFDIGDVLAQREVDVKPDVLMPELHDKLAAEGAALLIETLKGFPRSFETVQKQDDTFATFAPKITPEVTEVRWSELAARDVYNRFRALYGYKQLSAKFNGRSVKIIDLKLSAEGVGENSITPGLVVYCKNSKTLRIYCKDRHPVEVSKVKVEGKKVMSATDFNNGFLMKCSKEERVFQ